MMDDMGASAEPTGLSQAEPEVSALRASIPSAGEFPLVLIEWEDSVRPEASWQWLEDFAPSNAVHIQSVGWLIADGDVKALAPNIGGTDGDCEQASGIIHIPQRCIISVVQLSGRPSPNSRGRGLKTPTGLGASPRDATIPETGDA